MEMNYEHVEHRMRADYRLVTPQYRRDDEIEVTTENHRRLGQALQKICRSFDNRITVLDVGCGTGRYFHCLVNAARLVGLDISEDMLAAAGKPVCQEVISVPKIELIRGNAYLASFPAESFDFIYSLGMFGNGCPVLASTCDKFHSWLKPGGKFFFNVVDLAGLPLYYRLRRTLRTFLYPRLTGTLKKVFDRRQNRSPFFGLSKNQLFQILAATRFENFSLGSYPCQSPLWSGRHLECLAIKAGAASSADRDLLAA